MVKGEGAYFTVWANPDHVFSEFYRNGTHDLKHTIHFGTGNWGKGWGGPGINPNLHPHAGFTPYRFRDEPSRAEFDRQKKKKDAQGKNPGRDVKDGPDSPQILAPKPTGVFGDPDFTDDATP
jgi:hypothetical protein